MFWLLRLLHVRTQVEETQIKSAVELTLNVLAAAVATCTQVEETQIKSTVELTLNVVAAEIATCYMYTSCGDPDQVCG